MNRNQRKYGYFKKEEKAGDQYNQDDIVEVLPPRSKRTGARELLKTNRCCNVSPSQLNRSKDKESATFSLGEVLFPHYKEKLKPLAKTTPFEKQWKSPQRSVKTDKASQYEPPHISLVYLVTSKSNSNVCDSVDLNLSLQDDKASTSVKETRPSLDNIHITNVPRIKIIAEKFTKLQKNNLEVRQLAEKIVCVEYDVFDSEGRGFDSPVQTMRIYFSVKPDASKENLIDTLPSAIKKQFDITDNTHQFDTDLYLLDDKISENKPYVEDLKALKRKQDVKKNLYNLVSLYKMARDGPVLDEDLSNIISSTKLEELKNLIMNTAPSSLHGLSRRTVKNESGTENNERDGYVLQSLFAKVTE